MAKNTKITGRPIKYDDEWCEKTAENLPDMFDNGESMAEVVVALGVCWNTFKKCCDNNENLMKAKKEGLTRAEAWWQLKARQSVMGRIPGFNSTVWIFSMKNRFGWRDKHDVKMDGDIKIVIDEQDAGA